MQILVGAAALMAATALRITCVGDSITAGHCQTNTGGYPAVLQQLLGSSYAVSNYGNSGKTMLRYGLCGSTGGDCSYWNTSTYPGAIASSPDIVTIMLGTNDAKCPFNWIDQQALGDSFEQDYLQMIANFAALPSKPKIFVLVPPPLYFPFPYSMNETVINDVFPTLIRKIATEAPGANHTVIDVFNAMGGANLAMPGLFCDGCHPNDSGYIVLAETIASVLTGVQVKYDPLVHGKRPVPARALQAW